MKKRILTIILMVVMLVTYMPVVSFAGCSQVKKIHSYSTTTLSPQEQVYYYTDKYFSKPATKFNVSLATMSFGLATSTFTSYDHPLTQSEHAADIMKQMGMKSKTNKAYKQDPTHDSIGVIVGSKKIGCTTLIALAVRSGGYGTEWASNFAMGIDSDHKGFNSAMTQSLAFLKQYIKDNHIRGKVKFWLTGYSRGAATANLLGAALDRGELKASKLKYSKDDIYTYTFETPAGADLTKSPNSDQYSNIFNIVNINDLVTYVAPANLGFGRYGIDMYLPSREASPKTYAALMDKMVANLEKMDVEGKGYAIDTFARKNLSAKSVSDISLVDNESDRSSQGYFLSQFVPLLSDGVLVSRTNYVKYFEDFTQVLFGSDGFMEATRTKALKDYFIQSVLPVLTDISTNLLNQTSRKSALRRLNDIVKEMYRISKIAYSEQDVLNARNRLATSLLNFSYRNLDDVVTFAGNIKALVSGHMPNLCLAWLTSMDPNYGGYRVNLFNDGKFRIMKVHGDINLTVVDNRGKVVAQIKDGKVVDTNSVFVYGIDSAGQKYVVLPTEGKYTITLKALADTTVDILLDEFSSSICNYTRVTYFQDLALKSGKSITTLIGTNYEMTFDGGKKINPTSDITGDAAKDTLCDVRVNVENPTYGKVEGAGLYQAGNYIQLKATPKKNYSFNGWYDGKKKVSSKKTYEFKVEKDVTLTAKFKKGK
ncbi:MAG: hypothetical protein MJ146_04650 [Clostridia bacterium]|nr:hypothetical protein [Clostridia bacterium]